MALSLLLGGIMHIALAIFHMFFAKIFDWNDDLKKIRPINKSIMQTMNIMLTFVFLFFGFVSLFLQTELANSMLGIYIVGFISVFWLLRSIVHLLLFDMKNTKNKVFYSVCNAMFIFYGLETSHLVKTL